MSGGCGFELLKIISIKTTTTTPATDAMAHLRIGDFDFLEEAALGGVVFFLRSAGFCVAVACGVATRI